jgi:hypothetical protein
LPKLVSGLKKRAAAKLLTRDEARRIAAYTERVAKRSLDRYRLPP